jgi:hypothetical protein
MKYYDDPENLAVCCVLNSTRIGAKLQCLLEFYMKLAYLLGKTLKQQSGG